MKRRLILLAVVVALLAGFGALLHSPPSLVDASAARHQRQRKRSRLLHSSAEIMCFASTPQSCRIPDSARN